MDDWELDYQVNHGNPSFILLINLFFEIVFVENVIFDPFLQIVNVYFLQIWKLLLQSPFLSKSLLRICVCAYFAYRLTRQTVLQILQTVVLTSRRVSRVFHKYTIFWKLMSLIFGPIQAEVRKGILPKWTWTGPPLSYIARTPEVPSRVR